METPINSRCDGKNGNHALPAGLCWTGGKSRLKNRIVDIINKHPHKVYVEGFVGGGSVYWKKALVNKNIINDKNSELMWFYRNLRDTNCKNLQHCKLPANENQFKKAVGKRKKNICNFLGANKRSYACQMDKPKFNISKASEGNPREAGLENLKKSCNKYQEKLRKTKILNDDYKKVIKQFGMGKEAFVFLDPPYVDTYDYGQEPVHPEDVCDLARKSKGKVMITYNNHPRVKKACKKGLHIKKWKTNYEIQKSQTGKGKIVTELLITNFKP